MRHRILEVNRELLIVPITLVEHSLNVMPLVPADGDRKPRPRGRLLVDVVFSSRSVFQTRFPSPACEGGVCMMRS